MGVGGWGCPSSANVRRRTLASCAFRKRAPNSASAANAATSLSMVHVIWMAPFNLMGSPSQGRLPRKKYPPGLEADRYDALE